MIGITQTTNELSAQNSWFLYAVAALLVPVVLIWILNIRSTRLTGVDLAASGFGAWYLLCFLIHGSVTDTALMESCFLAVAYISFRILFSSSRNALKWLFIIICICGILEAMTGIRQALGMQRSNHWLFNVTGSFFNPGPYGGYIAIILSVALSYAVGRYGYTSRVFACFRSFRTITLRKALWALTYSAAILSIILIIIVLPSTMSRAAFVAVAVSGLAIFAVRRTILHSFSAYISRNRTKCTVIGAIALVVICSGAYYMYAVKKDSADGRLLMWKIAAKAMLAHPAIGVGPGYFGGVYGDVQAGYFGSEKRSETEIKIAGSPEFAFNEYLKIGTETGITGLLLFLVFVFTALFRLLRARSYYAYGLLALLVFAFFSYPFSILPIKILFVLFLAAAGTRPNKQRPARTGEIAIIGTALAGCVTAIIMLFTPYTDRIGAVKEWKELQRWYGMEFYNYIVEDSPGLYPLLKDNPAFIFAYGRSLNMEEKYRESIGILMLGARQSADPMFYNVMGNSYKALEEYDNAAQSYLKAYYMIPNRLYPLYLLAKLYTEAGDTAQAKVYALQVTDMAPKVESSATREMVQEMEELLQKLGRQ